MKSARQTCSIDGLGRVLIPSPVRKRFSLIKGTSLELFTENGCIILKKVEPTCAICDGNENLIESKGKFVCKACLEELNSKL